MAHVAAITVLDPSKLPGVPQPLPKGWGAADWDVPDGTDVVAALRGAVTVTSAAPTVELVPIDPTYPTEIVLPPAIIALEPDRGIPLPAGDVGILAGQGGERKSTLTIQMAVAAAAAEDGALVSPFTGLAVDTNDPFIVGGDVGLAVRGGPVCMASWEDAAPWLATRARACAEHLDAQSHSTRHTRVLRDAQRLASVQMSAPLFGVTAVGRPIHRAAHDRVGVGSALVDRPGGQRHTHHHRSDQPGGGLDRLRAPRGRGVHVGHQVRAWRHCRGAARGAYREKRRPGGRAKRARYPR